MNVLIDNPLVVLFLVVAIGAAAGSVRIKGVSLGPSAALFAGLAVSAVDERLGNTPLIVSQVGLALFIYTVGLASGPSFLAGVRHGGSKVLAAAAGVKVVDDAAKNYFPMPIDASGQGDVLAGRIRTDVSDPSGHSLALFVCGDQLLKGAVGKDALAKAIAETHGS